MNLDIWYYLLYVLKIERLYRVHSVVYMQFLPALIDKNQCSFCALFYKLSRDPYTYLLKVTRLNVCRIMEIGISNHSTATNLDDLFYPIIINGYRICQNLS